MISDQEAGEVYLGFASMDLVGPDFLRHAYDMQANSAEST